MHGQSLLLKEIVCHLWSKQQQFVEKQESEALYYNITCFIRTDSLHERHHSPMQLFPVVFWLVSVFMMDDREIN